MASVAYVIWDRQTKEVVAPTPNGAYSTTTEADDVLASLRAKSGNLGRSHYNLERMSVNVDH